MQARSEVCPSCGIRRADDTLYVGDIEVCPGCVVLESERENVPERAKGVHVGLRRRGSDEEEAERAERAERLMGG